MTKVRFDLETGGFKFDSPKMTLLTGQTGVGKSLLPMIRLDPLDDKSKGTHMVSFEMNQSEEITRLGFEILNKILETNKDWVETDNTDKIIRKYECFGQHIFPVSYYPNGMVLVDYPNLPLCEQLRRKYYDNSTSSSNK